MHPASKPTTESAIPTRTSTPRPIDKIKIIIEYGVQHANRARISTSCSARAQHSPLAAGAAPLPAQAATTGHCAGWARRRFLLS
ncbi:hypothetical protein GCM10010109_90470 [Actinoplanes campanulatus]|nr:hypothetical protein GCM10010109_90470 [Actinoplanes campanulatus]GID42146.1 hypothetical protein Aca09nite_86520 [Actinoplanes campanulatus]